MLKVFILLIIMSQVCFAAVQDITIKVDVDKFALSVPIPKNEEGKSLYKTNKEWVEAFIVENLKAQEFRFRKFQKKEDIEKTEIIDNAIAEKLGGL